VKKKTPKSLAQKPQPPWTTFQEGSYPDDPIIQAIRSEPGYVGVFVNSRYQVQMREQDTPLGRVTWLSIVRRDREVIRDWRELQRIKNELLGPEREAVELYPAESRLVDTNNQQHLFVLPEGAIIPFGYMQRDVSDERGLIPGTIHKQRPFEVSPQGVNERINDSIIGTVYGTGPYEEGTFADPSGTFADKRGTFAEDDAPLRPLIDPSLPSEGVQTDAGIDRKCPICGAQPGHLCCWAWGPDYPGPSHQERLP